jgi:hypothetical protein
MWIHYLKIIRIPKIKKLIHYLLKVIIINQELLSEKTPFKIQFLKSLLKMKIKNLMILMKFLMFLNILIRHKMNRLFLKLKSQNFVIRSKVWKIMKE